MLSIIVPAHNEESLLGETLRTLRAAVVATGEPYELIVVDDASTDRTAAIAREHGATVVPVELRKISAVRNAGAKEATGNILVFVDADTHIPEATLAAALAALRAGAIGGGALFRADEKVPIWGEALIVMTTMLQVVLRFAGGCFVFVRREDFEAVGGFDEQYYASEEIWLSRALRTRGRFVILRQRVITSARKFRVFTGREWIVTMWRMVSAGRAGLRKRHSFWYRAQRLPSDKP